METGGAEAGKSRRSSRGSTDEPKMETEQAAVARCRGDKLETGLERGVGYRSSVVRMARSYAGCLCCCASSADHAEMSGGMWGARFPESAATLSPMAALPTASLEADPKTLEGGFGDALGRAVWGGLVEVRLEVCRGTRSVSIFGSSVEPREERRDLPGASAPVSIGPYQWRSSTTTGSPTVYHLVFRGVP